MTRRAYVATGMAVGLVLGGAALMSPAGAEQPSAGCATPTLAHPQSAQDVGETKPGVLRAAAVRNEDSVPGLVARAQKDDSIWLDRCVEAFYAEDKATAAEKAAAGATMGAATAAAASLPLAAVPLADTFTLESKPGSARTIYLDFKGATVTGTAWNNSYGGTLVFEPYSIDATVSTNFSDAELTEIQKTWQVVAEDYAPFDVNVTLKDPGAAAHRPDLVDRPRLRHPRGDHQRRHRLQRLRLRRRRVRRRLQHLRQQPQLLPAGLVFSNGTTKNGKYVGEATSHEVGHNFGLNHDGTASSGYYSGSAPWAPIMGASYNQPVTQWSKGEYPGANNPQDDLTQIATGAPVRADEDTAGPIALANSASAAASSPAARTSTATRSPRPAAPPSRWPTARRSPTSTCSCGSSTRPVPRSHWSTRRPPASARPRRPA